MRDVGIVAIGRNEGERLKACLHSLPADCPIVYVDSGSTDGSVTFAQSMGVTVVELDMSIPFTAARARNAGFAALLRLKPDLVFVQMIDGDCVIDPAWLGAGIAALSADNRLAAVFGRLRERYPERSLYNRLCDREWDVPVGDVMACGGIALIRADRLADVDGYDATLIAGEEPDLCARMRERGWLIRRIPAEMALHDAAMTRFGQYWRRTKRNGHACSELAWRAHGAPDPLWERQARSILIWAVAIPALIFSAVIIGATLTGFGWIAAIALLLLYPVQILRIARRERRDGASSGFAFARAALLVVGKFAELQGLIAYHRRRLTGGGVKLIEYKDATTR
ncbi:glycosyltransferase family 2 protein [Sphingomonas sp. DBB INV C78]|uniref:glycosyltransferase family 2 protein n=1 Tax=Sphingomonas sp. DBB INV C78 TaxID=3349434 RepID=UPI0036D28B02